MTVTTVHEIVNVQYWPESHIGPAERTVRCSCGWEGESIGSISGPPMTARELFDGHVEEVDA